MGSIGELITGLRGALRKIAEGGGHLDQAETAWSAAASAHAAALAGSQQPEARLLAELDGLAAGQCGAARARLGQCVEQIEALIRHYAGEPVSGAVERVAAKPYQNPHGDNYPPEAAAMAGALPRRVVPNNGERTVSVTRVNGRIIPGVSSGGTEETDPQVSAAARLLRELGYDEDGVAYLMRHAEIKTLAMLQQFGVQVMEIAVNNTPCGVERFQRLEAVCHKALEALAARHGIELTVYGTYQDNRPYKHRYGRRTS